MEVINKRFPPSSKPSSLNILWNLRMPSNKRQPLEKAVKSEDVDVECENTQG
jgi:hypothetical protein